MDKFDATQLDLFSQSQAVLRRPSSGAGFLLRFRLYERVLLLGIGFIITAIIAFALGVEEGRRLVSPAAGAAIARPLPALEKRMPAVPSGLPIMPKAVPFQGVPSGQPVFLAKVPAPRQGYTIQIASFKSRDFAQQEADALRKLGYAPVELTKGSYVVLCVGNFSDKESAKPVLTELTRKYQGCFLRRI